MRNQEILESVKYYLCNPCISIFIIFAIISIIIIIIKYYKRYTGYTGSSESHVKAHLVKNLKNKEINILTCDEFATEDKIIIIHKKIK
jgi:predicted negative regulator of RcsB-dependent stress response